MVFVSSAIKCRILVCLLLAIKDLGFLCWPVFVFVFGRVQKWLSVLLFVEFEGGGSRLGFNLCNL